MAGGLVKVHRDITNFGGFKETLFAKSHIKLLNKAQYLIYISIRAIIGKKNDEVSSLRELPEPPRASP